PSPVPAEHGHSAGQRQRRIQLTQDHGLECSAIAPKVGSRPESRFLEFRGRGQALPGQELSSRYSGARYGSAGRLYPGSRPGALRMNRPEERPRMFNKLLDPEGYKLPRLCELGPQIGQVVGRLEALTIPQLATEIMTKAFKPDWVPGGGMMDLGGIT